MSSVIKPVGPEDPKIYWRRRALFAGLVVLVLLILWWLFFRPSGEEPVPTASGSPSAAVTNSPNTSPTGSPTPSASPSSPSGNCADSDIGVTVTTNQATYPAGAMPQITLSITNEGSLACTRDVGSGANSIEVSSGGVRVWSSDDCSTDNEPDIVTLEPGQKASVTVEWTRIKSEEGCPTDQPEVEPGSYDAVGTNGEISSKKASFVLE